MKQQITKLNNLHIAPRKVRLITDTLKGLPVQEAEAQLLMRPQRSSRPLLKLLRSAAANAQNNQKLERSKLFVSKILVNQGPMLKRFLPRAMGRATPIQKKSSHVILVLEEAKGAFSERFTITPPPKKEKKEKKPRRPGKAGVSTEASGINKREKGKIEKEERIEKKREKVGFFKRLFRRKSV